MELTASRPHHVQLFDLLAEAIRDSDEEVAIQLIETLDSKALRDLEKYRLDDKDDDPTTDSDINLLQLAAAYSVSRELLCLLATKAPGLLSLGRRYPYEGQTALHTLISKENVQVVDTILSQHSPPERRRLLTLTTVTDKAVAINATVMLGGLPLSIAALTFNLEMVDMLLSYGAELSDSNDRGDTVFHSLVRFSALYPEKEAKAEKMMKDLHQRLKRKHEPRSVWLKENQEGLTVMKLAAQCTQPLLFNFVVSLKGVYCDLDEHDGLFDSLLYDITEIDPVATRSVAKAKAKASARRNQVASALVLGLPKDGKMAGSRKGADPSSGGPPAPHRRTDLSVLDIIYETDQVEDAFKILDNHVVRCVIRDQWARYEALFCAWMVTHLLSMIWLTTYAVFKARLVSSEDRDFSPAGTNLTISFTSAGVTDSETKFVYASAVLGAILAMLLLVYEVVWLARRSSVKEYLVGLVYHHNGFYRLQMMVFSIFVLLEVAFLAAWYWTGMTAYNHFLIVALLVGWWFCSFFLRPWRKFSFFTVMLQEVLLGDMLRFSTIFIPQLLAFSVAMYVTYQPSESPVPMEFATVGRTMMTMFKLMLGLSDVNVLYEAPDEWLAILLFLLYVLLTYSLMLNSLIALMSNTCSIISQNSDNQWKLQRLSIVLFLQESLWALPCLSSVGQPRTIRVEDLHSGHSVAKTRYFMKISSVRGGDGGAVLEGALDNLMDGEAGGIGDDEECQTKVSSDLCDLMAALNFQRKQKHVKSPEEPAAEAQSPGEQTQKKDCSPRSNGVNITVQNNNSNFSYVNIRHSIQKLTKNPVGASTRLPKAVPASQRLGRVQAAPRESDFTDGLGHASKPPLSNDHHQNRGHQRKEDRSRRNIVNNVPETHPVPQPTPTIVLLPSPCLITDIGEEQQRSTSRSKRAEKREKLRKRPDSAELQEKFRKRREQLRGKGLVKPEDSASSARPPSASSTYTDGVIMVDQSRIHMRAKE